MAHLPTPYVLRLAIDGELPRAIAIDDAAVSIFAEAGVIINLSDDHPFVLSEHRCWERALTRGDLFFACAGEAGAPAGFIALDVLGDRAYLEQLSVHPDHQRRGLGRALVEEACERFRARGAAEIWLTTYAHVPWNAPFYERCGFRVVPQADCNAELQAVLEQQRSALPHPEQRVAMVRPLSVR